MTPATHLPPGRRGAVVAAGLVVLVTLTIGFSTVAANWVPGSGVLPWVGLGGALALCALAGVRSLPWPVALGGGLAAAPLLGWLVTRGALTAAHPADPEGLAWIQTWLGRIGSGQAASDNAFFLLLLCALFWIVGGWLAWAVLRWRQPVLGLVPGSAALATNVLNYPADQGTYTFLFLVLTMALLLWSSHLRVGLATDGEGLFRTGNARLEFWENGVAATALVVVLGTYLPPLSQADVTVDIENAAFTRWSDLQTAIHKPLPPGHGGGAATTGFAYDVPLAGPIKLGSATVFSYKPDSDYSGSRYFRGVNLNGWDSRHDWSYDCDSFCRGTAPTFVTPGSDPQATTAAAYLARATSGIDIQLVREAAGSSDTGRHAGATLLVYPDQLRSVDHAAIAVGLQARSGLETVDRLASVDRLRAYQVQVSYTSATEEQLRAAPTAYPPWTALYRNSFRGSDPAVSARISALAAEVTKGVPDNPYDKATAIETYLRSAAFTYTLSPASPPPRSDPLDFFLFQSRKGYCQYFASAMGDMLRALQIPSRLVNGYGPGGFDQKQNRYLVHESDAHTWVEVFFPNYGWIAFEPTPDGTYFPLARGQQAAQTEPAPVTPSPNPAPSSPSEKTAAEKARAGSHSPLPFPIPPLGPWPQVAAILIALLAAAYVATSRYLRPTKVGAVWRRAGLLSRLAGLPGLPSETPLEYGRRLGARFPEAEADIKELASAYVVAAYAPPSRAAATRTSVLASWERLLPMLLRRIASRLRLRIPQPGLSSP